tara:strand:- start:470 stop:754 length:285 start_codon:yes stop_codon:yes gene_type:complete
MGEEGKEMSKNDIKKLVKTYNDSTGRRAKYMPTKGVIIVDGKRRKLKDGIAEIQHALDELDRASDERKARERNPNFDSEFDRLGRRTLWGRRAR